MSQPLKKQQIIGIFGEKAGTKLLQWLDPCCTQFCESILNCIYVPVAGTDYSNGVKLISLPNGVVGTMVGNQQSIGEFVKLVDGSGQIDLEVSSPDGTVTSALKINPKIITFGDYGSFNYFLVDYDLGQYGIGDLDGAPGANGTNIYIDDVAQKIYLRGTIGYLINAIYPAYANDAAAGLGGLVAGDHYQTDGSDITFAGGAVGLVVVKQ